MERTPAAATTEGLARNHMIYVSEPGLLTIAGGKWTTYRAMAEETVYEVVNMFGLEGEVTNGCMITQPVRLIGSDGWCRNTFIGLTQRVCTRGRIVHDRNLFSTVYRQTLRNNWQGTVGIEPVQCARWLNRQGIRGHCTGFG